MGRPTKCTHPRIKKICAFIERGNYAVVAAQRSGISKKTYENWVNRGEEEPDSIYGTFLRAIKDADAFAENDLLEATRKAAVTDGHKWQAFMTILERRFRGRWGRPAAGAPDPVTVNVKFDPAAWQRDLLGVEHEEQDGEPCDEIELPRAAEETKGE